MRPPGGGYSDRVKAAVDFPLILWSIDTLDWKTQNADSTVKAVFKDVKDGDIILMHDLYKASASAAERIICLLYTSFHSRPAGSRTCFRSGICTLRFFHP